MSYKTLYRKYRPVSFKDVVGQNHIVQIIQNAINQDKISHAYLFCGPRGTGKTSMAKLLAKAVNCQSTEKPCGKCESCQEATNGSHPDIIELDAASNNGVEQIREIVEKVKYTPIIGKYKIYIIDEVHMLSTSAFNALLKTLEEPPGYVIFILATTDPQKVLPTIISRCQRYNFSKVTIEDIQKRLMGILDEEKVTYEKEALALIGELADGGVRDALSILEQCLAFDRSHVSVQMVSDVFGVASTKDKLKLLYDCHQTNVKEALNQFEKMMQEGVNIKRLTNDLLILLKEGLIYHLSKDETILHLLNKETASTMIATLDQQNLSHGISVLMKTQEQFKYCEDPKIYFEMALLKLSMTQGISQVSASSQETRRAEVPTVKKEVGKVHIEKEVVKQEVKQQEIHQVEEVRISQPETKKEKIVTSQEVVMHDMEFLLGLLVQANKQEKEVVISAFEQLRELKMNMQLARFARMLSEVSLVAVGQSFILVSTDYEALANEINEEYMNKCLYQFVHDELKLDRMIYAIDQGTQKSLIELFKQRREEGSLPQDVTINKHQLENTQEKEQIDPTASALKDLFGDANIEIKEEN
ncbi:MAG: DNA polymerase III subunit gamma/tau [Erysipelotrichaceae bacterium]